MATRRGNLPGCDHQWIESHDAAIGRNIRTCSRCGRSEVIPASSTFMRALASRQHPARRVDHVDPKDARIEALEKKLSTLILAIRQSGVADAIPEFEKLWKEEDHDLSD